MIFEVKCHKNQLFENIYFLLLSIVFVFITKVVEQKIVYKLCLNVFSICWAGLELEGAED